MTKADLEQIARKMRATGLRSTWNELIEFSDSVVGGLAEAYQALLRERGYLDSLPPDIKNRQLLVKDRLSKALIFFSSPDHVARLESEIADAGCTTLLVEN